MKIRRRWAATALAGAVLAALPAIQAHAATTPPWEPDPNARGTITFYNAAGAVITSGSIAHIADYAAASTAGDSGAIKAGLSFAAPDHTKPDSNSWFSGVGAANTAYPNASAPAPVKNLTTPVVTIAPTDGNLQSFIGSAISDTTTGYANIYQVRLRDAGGTATSVFWSADLLVNTAAGTWTQVYPTVVAGPTTTTTSLTASPAGSANVGATVTLTATVSPSAAAGTVQFAADGTSIGSPVTVSGGVATTTTTTLALGGHSLTAAFTPTDATAFSASSATPVTYSIHNPLTATTTTLTVSPASPVTVGTSETLTATVTPTAAAGTVQFKDGGANLGSPVTVTSGTATLTTSALAGATTHSLTAQFLPTDTATYAGSTSAAVPLTVNAVSTTTALAISAAGPVNVGTSETLTATVSPSSAMGAVQFKDGSANLGSPVALASGTAALTTTALAAGTHSLTAQFVPTNAGSFATSTSAAVPLTVNAVTSTTTLSISPAKVAYGHSALATVHVTATSGVPLGLVQIKQGSTVVASAGLIGGSRVIVLPRLLAPGFHSLVAYYVGSSSVTASHSVAVGLGVTKGLAAVTARLSSSRIHHTARDRVTISLSALGTVPTGRVVIRDGSRVLGTVILVRGRATFLLPLRSIGRHRITVTYTGSGLYLPAVSRVLLLTVVR